MKTVKGTAYILTILTIIGLAVSCASTGEYMPIAEGETVIGTVQTTFLVPSTFFSVKKVKDTLNKQAYVALMETAGNKYPGSIDLRDIVWVTGNTVNNTKTEIFATAKVVKIE